MSLLVKNPERLPDLVLDLGVLDLPGNYHQHDAIKNSKINLGVLDQPQSLGYPLDFYQIQKLILVSWIFLKILLNLILNSSHLVISHPDHPDYPDSPRHKPDKLVETY